MPAETNLVALGERLNASSIVSAISPPSPSMATIDVSKYPSAHAFFRVPASNDCRRRTRFL